MTLAYHMTEMPWREVLKKAVSMNYLSHQAGTCGLHIHVNRDSLGITNRQQENTIARILFLVETFWHELLRFSGRRQRSSAAQPPDAKPDGSLGVPVWPEG